MGALPEVERFVRDIKGPAASILWALFLSGSNLTNKQLESATGYSDKSVAKGLERLEGYGIVQNNGRFYGWSMASVKQLPLPMQELWRGHHGLLEDRGTETGRPQEVACSAVESQATLLADVGSQDTLPSAKGAVDKSVGNTALSQPPTPSSNRLPQTKSEKFRLDPNKVGEFPTSTASEHNEVGEFPTSASQSRRISDFASRDLDCLIDLTLKDKESINQSDQREGQSRKISELRQLMRLVGINGRTFTEFEQWPLDPDCLRAWHWWSLCQTWIRNPPGYIATVLRDNQLPDGAWLEAVRWWRSLLNFDREAILTHLQGHDNGIVLHEPVQSANDLVRYLRLDELPQPSDRQVLVELVTLGQKAPDALSAFLCDEEEGGDG